MNLMREFDGDSDANHLTSFDFSLQSEREDQMSCGQEKQQLLDCTGGDGVNAKETEDWEGIAAEDNASFNLSTFMYFLSRFGMLG
jgi:hypothetical protein